MDSFDVLLWLEEYGANEYLACLRKRYARGGYTWDHYCFLAARAYLALHKPIRALALLESSTPEYTPAGSAQSLRDLAAQARTEAAGHSHPTCSLNMIVKNESRNVGQALDTVDEFMDQIVICDTGSVDDTTEVARLYGITLLSERWRNDFSAARNAAIEASSCDWVFWMDADDRLLRTSANALVQLWRSEPPQCALLCVVNKADGVTGVEFLQARLFPRRDGLRFERRIHEQIMLSAQRLGLAFVQHPDIKILHTGYDDPAALRLKAARNRALILQELKVYSTDPTLHLSLGDACMTLGDFQAAGIAYERAHSIAGAQDLSPEAHVQSYYSLALAHRNLGNTDQAEQALLTCISLDPSRIEAHFLLGSILRENGNLDEARNHFLRCIQIVPPVRLTTANNTKTAILATLNAAQILVERHDYPQACDILTKAIEKHPGVVDFYNLLGKSYFALRQLPEAAKAYTRSLALSSDVNPEPYHGLADIYELLGEFEKAETCAARAAASEHAGHTRDSQRTVRRRPARTARGVTS